MPLNVVKNLSLELILNEIFTSFAILENKMHFLEDFPFYLQNP